MKVGDLVRNIYSGEVCLITSEAQYEEHGYFEVHLGADGWLVPEDHLEAISESR